MQAYTHSYTKYICIETSGIRTEPIYKGGYTGRYIFYIDILYIYIRYKHKGKAKRGTMPTEQCGTGTVTEARWEEREISLFLLKCKKKKPAMETFCAQRGHFVGENDTNEM